MPSRTRNTDGVIGRGDLVEAARDLHRWFPFGYVDAGSPGMVATNKSWLSGKLVVCFQGRGFHGVPRMVAVVATEEDLVPVVIHDKRRLVPSFFIRRDF